MFDKQKVKELKLLVKDDTGCGRKLGIDECPKRGCEVCATEHAEKHFEMINESGEFDCSNCLYTKKIMGRVKNEVFTCDICKPLVLKYITQDFKNIFNKIEEEKCQKE